MSELPSKEPKEEDFQSNIIKQLDKAGISNSLDVVDSEEVSADIETNNVNSYLSFKPLEGGKVAIEGEVKIQMSERQMSESGLEQQFRTKGFTVTETHNHDSSEIDIEDETHVHITITVPITEIPYTIAKIDELGSMALSTKQSLEMSEESCEICDIVSYLSLNYWKDGLIPPEFQSMYKNHMKKVHGATFREEELPPCPKCGSKNIYYEDVIQRYLCPDCLWKGIPKMKPYNYTPKIQQEEAYGKTSPYSTCSICKDIIPTEEYDDHVQHKHNKEQRDRVGIPTKQETSCDCDHQDIDQAKLTQEDLEYLCTSLECGCANDKNKKEDIPTMVPYIHPEITRSLDHMSETGQGTTNYGRPMTSESVDKGSGTMVPSPAKSISETGGTSNGWKPTTSQALEKTPYNEEMDIPAMLKFIEGFDDDIEIAKNNDEISEVEADVLRSYYTQMSDLISKGLMEKAIEIYNKILKLLERKEAQLLGLTNDKIFLQEEKETCDIEGCDNPVITNRAIQNIKDKDLFTLPNSRWGHQVCAEHWDMDWISGRDPMPKFKKKNEDSYMKCISCDGTRLEECFECDGDGKYSDGTNCEECDGEGEIPCTFCDGAGVIPTMTCPVCEEDKLIYWGANMIKCLSCGLIEEYKQPEYAKLHKEVEKGGMCEECKKEALSLFTCICGTRIGECCEERHLKSCPKVKE